MTDTNHIKVLREIQSAYPSGGRVDDAIDAAITALSARASAGEGGEWVMVPRKVTHAMLVAYWSYGSDEPLDESLLTDGDLGVFQGEWNDILAAAPQPQECDKLRPGAPCPAPHSCRENGCGAVERELFATPPAHGDGEVVRGEATGDTPTFLETWMKLTTRDRAIISSYFRETATRPTPEAQEARDAVETKAQALYNASIGDSHNLHCLHWLELTQYQRIEWRKKAALALPAQGEGNNG